MVIALGLFAAGAAVVMGGLYASTRAAAQLRLQADAADLGVTVMSRVQIGELPAVNAGPVPFEEEDRKDWTWQTVVEPVEVGAAAADVRLQRVTVVVRHADGYAYRLAEWMDAAAAGGGL